MVELLKLVTQVILIVNMTFLILHLLIPIVSNNNTSFNNSNNNVGGNNNNNNNLGGNTGITEQSQVDA